MNKIQTIRLLSFLFLLCWFTISNAQTSQLKSEPIHEKEKMNVNVLESDFSSNPDLYLIYIPNPIVCELAYEIEIITPESGCQAGSANRVVVVTFSGISSNTEYAINPQGGAIIVQKAEGIYQVVGNGTWSITASESQNCSETAENSELPYVSNADMTEETGIAQNDGSATVEITGGIAPYNVVWSNNLQGTINSSGESHTISGLAAGQYEAVVTDNSGIVSKVCITVSRKRSGRGGRGGKTTKAITSNGLTAYPNPFAHNTAISFNLPEDALTTLRVYNVSGKLMEMVYQGETEGGQDYHVKVNADTWTAGIYIVQLTTNNGFVTHQRLLVTK